jgi:hypothetical protein
MRYHFIGLFVNAALAVQIGCVDTDLDPAEPDGHAARQHVDDGLASSPTVAQVDDGLPAEPAALAAAPSISSIGGVTNGFGLLNGAYSRAQLGNCASDAWNGYRVLNDQTGMYPWTISGTGFGASRPTVTLGGFVVPVLSWSNTSIQIDPTTGYSTSPTSRLLTIQRPDGASTQQWVSVVNSIRSRVYGQCTWHVAKRRLEMGRAPSPTAYGGYTGLENWSPAVGDQLQWSGTHTAIIESIGFPIAGPFGSGETTIPITISQANAACTSQVTSYSTTYKYRVINNVRTVLERPRYSAGSAGATGYYR